MQSKDTTHVVQAPRNDCCGHQGPTQAGLKGLAKQLERHNTDSLGDCIGLQLLRTNNSNSGKYLLNNRLTENQYTCTCNIISGILRGVLLKLNHVIYMSFELHTCMYPPQILYMYHPEICTWRILVHVHNIHYMYSHCTSTYKMYMYNEQGGHAVIVPTYLAHQEYGTCSVTFTTHIDSDKKRKTKQCRVMYIHVFSILA